MSKHKMTDYPLRKVVGTKRITYGTVAVVLHELLECGHDLSPSMDRHGPTSPTRRRCWKCPKRGEVVDLMKALEDSLRPTQNGSPGVSQ